MIWPDGKLMVSCMRTGLPGDIRSCRGDIGVEGLGLGFRGDTRAM